MILQGLFDGLRPVPMKKVSDWADENRRLTTESAAEPGPWRTDRTPYLRAVMDDLSPTSPINEVVVAKGVQLGFSESALNVVGCFIDISPCPIMYVMPTIEMATAISQDRVQPMIENSDSLKARVAPQRSRDSTNTILVKSFPGGRLILSGGNSAASLRSRPVRVLVLDEVDAYPLDVNGEGSPVALAEKRTSTYSDRRKVYKLSTPTTEGQSVIQRELEKTEINRYHVPCPFCGAEQYLKFEQLRWDKGRPETVVYECEHCNEGIEERYKTRMLAAGSWRATIPANQRRTTRGYHISSLY
jgi:phage terminase large subunit GpA-like protein